MNPEIRKGLSLGITVAFISFFLFYSSNILMVYYHENAHSEVYERYNIESEININWYSVSGTTAVDKKEYEEKCDDFCKLAQNQTEIVGYHLMGLVNVLVLLFSIYIMIKLMGANYGREETNSNTI